MNTAKEVALVVGASRGIGRQIAIDLALAKGSYRVIVAAKSISDAYGCSTFPPDPNSPQSTISTVEREIREAGGEAAAIAVDVRDFDAVQRCVQETVELYGRLDVLIYNSGAIWWASVEDTPMKRFQLMQRVNPEGLYGFVQASLPHLKKRGSGRIIVVSPPIYSRFFRGKVSYAMGKISMSVLTKGLAMDFQRQGLTNMAITSIWPAAAIESGATQKMTQANPKEAEGLRKATIFSDAVLAMLKAPADTINGRLELDEDYLRNDAGVTDFSKYSLIPGTSPRRIMPAQLPNLAVKEQDDEGQILNSADNRAKL
ncbi:hypothetical protein F4808DRAFT_151702 [Astrocystis sublimbata]|nr:hypothetical protein F4808DRAFT_151702 [Astrocystis sublimbata]